MEMLDNVLEVQLVHLREHAPVTFSPFGSIIAVFAVTMMCKAVGQFFLLIDGKGMANKSPRRSMAAHFNGFEALQLLSAAVLMGCVAGLKAEAMTELCTLYVYSRVAYSVAYIFISFNEVFSFIRSAIWGIGIGALIKIMVLASDKQYGYVFKLK